MLRFALVALIWTTGAEAGVRDAVYSEPTTRYAHGVLGDAIEYGALDVTTDAGARVTLRLPQSRVFEDIAPRLTDMDGDGDAEIIVVESALQSGARLAIYDETGLIAATPYIGRPNRWLAPLGAADLDGDGRIEVAYIDRPHLAKTLRIWRFENGTLVHLSDTPGLTNHKIGEDFISGGIRICDGAPEIITANANWTQIMATRFDGTSTDSQRLGAFTGPASLKAATSCP
ncbi:MAG: VCBS repeat-containing protein [Pseudomonadota bacterium]